LIYESSSTYFIHQVNCPLFLIQSQCGVDAIFITVTTTDELFSKTISSLTVTI